MALTRLALLKVPVPEVVHVDETALPPRVALNVYVFPEQMVALLPAFTVAKAFIVSTIPSLAALQDPVGLSVVSVSVTDPEEISDAEGVYRGVSKVASVKVPVPELVHNDDEALPPNVPERM